MSGAPSGDEPDAGTDGAPVWWHSQAATTHSYHDLVLSAVVGHLLRRAQQIHAALWSECVPGGITSPQYAVLHVLARHPRVDQTRLGELASLDRSTTADIARRLLTRGLVERHRDAHDTRRYLLELTASGRALLDAATAPALEVDRRMVDGLTDRQAEELVHLLRLVLASGGRPVDGGPTQ